VTEVSPGAFVAAVFHPDLFWIRITVKDVHEAAILISSVPDAFGTEAQELHTGNVREGHPECREGGSSGRRQVSILRTTEGVSGQVDPSSHT